MYKKLFFILMGFIFLTNIQISAENCVTGYACSLDNTKNEQIDSNENIIKNAENEDKDNNKKEKKKKEKKDGLFVDGGEFNKPQYTEMFTKYDLFP